MDAPFARFSTCELMQVSAGLAARYRPEWFTTFFTREHVAFFDRTTEELVRYLAGRDDAIAFIAEIEHLDLATLQRKQEDSRKSTILREIAKNDMDV